MRRTTRCEWCGRWCSVDDFFLSRVFSHYFPRLIRRFVTLCQQLRAATTPVPLAQRLRSYARALFFGQTGYFTASSLMLIVAAALGFAITMGQFGSSFIVMYFCYRMLCAHASRPHSRRLFIRFRVQFELRSKSGEFSAECSSLRLLCAVLSLLNPCSRSFSWV